MYELDSSSLLSVTVSPFGVRTNLFGLSSEKFLPCLRAAQKYRQHYCCRRRTRALYCSRVSPSSSSSIPGQNRSGTFRQRLLGTITTFTTQYYQTTIRTAVGFVSDVDFLTLIMASADSCFFAPSAFRIQIFFPTVNVFLTDNLNFFKLFSN